MSTIEILAADAFQKAERVKMLEEMNTPFDYDDRKRAFVELAKARQEAAEACGLIEPRADR